MGAGASTGTADLGGLTDTAVPASQATTASKDFAAKLKATLSTQDGWRDLQELFRSLRSSLDEAVSGAEWGSRLSLDDGLRAHVFGDATPEEIAEQFGRLDEGGGGAELTWEEFVDGAISLGAASELQEALASAEDEAELRGLFDTCQADEAGRVWLNDFAGALKANPEYLRDFFGLDSEASSRFRAFFMTGRADVWIAKVFRRLGLNDGDAVTWDEFRAGGG